MEQKVESIINKYDLSLIANHQFDLSLKGLNFPLNTQLVKILVPNYHSFTYVFIENNKLTLPKSDRNFFETLQLNDRVHMLLKAEINFNTISITEILFSLDSTFTDLKIDSQPIIRTDIIETVKNILPPSVYLLKDR